MGLPNFHTQADGVLPILVMNTIFSVVLLKNMVKWMIQIVGSYGCSTSLEHEQETGNLEMIGNFDQGVRRVAVTRFESGDKSGDFINCSVCLCRFEDGEEVSELSCKHFFHKQCLEKWFEDQHRTCPLCRSMF